MKQQVSYFNVAEFPGWKKAPAFLEAIIASRNPEVVLEIGCGPNPTLPLFNLKEIRYIISDLEEHELKKAREGYERRVLDMEGERMPEDLLGSCDLVFSRMVNEHVKDGKKYHQNIFDVLKPGGIAVHCFSTLYGLPFLVNRVSPNFVADKLLDIFSPRDREYHDRFPAYYSWCRGPTKGMLKKFEGLGYVVLSYHGYYGHGYYKKQMSIIDNLEKIKSSFLTRHPVPILCSYANVILQKP